CYKENYRYHKKKIYQHNIINDVNTSVVYALKVCVFLLMAALLFPLLVWGGFVFLPFDAPLLHGAPFRLVYTLRCSALAATPVILGWLVLGISRLRFGAVRPLVEDELKEAELKEVAVHRRFITDSASLYVLYSLQLVVMAMFVSQEQLKIIPLLMVVFALGRLVYWVSSALNSSVRAFGFGLSFLPSVAMLVANLYFIFTAEMEPMLSAQSGRQRFWG
uniref:Transmembrane protein 79-like n=1 Tax=Gouania willdenowi TaxID=441366 RepID=A0A8C5GD93_GOUWI